MARALFSLFLFPLAALAQSPHGVNAARHTNLPFNVGALAELKSAREFIDTPTTPERGLARKSVLSTD